MSSHREAPEISKDPVADSTDVYAFVSPSDPDKVVLIANYVPFQKPDGGPTFYEFGDDVIYEIHISNRGKAEADISYQFRFTTEIRNPRTFLYNVGPITSIGDKNWNRPQYYSVTRVENGKKRRLAGKLACPPVNVGPRSTPNYGKLSAQAVHRLGNRRFFVGPRADPFFVDLGSVFDLAGLRPLNQAHLIPLAAMDGINGLQSFNVHTIAIEVPITDLTRDGKKPKSVNDKDATIGVWTTAKRQKNRMYDDDENRYKGTGPWEQVSRLGNPLINEALIPMALKDKWNHTAPKNDSRFRRYVDRPELAGLLPVLYPGAFPNLAKYGKDRADLNAILHTGIPKGVVPGFQNFTGAVQADMLRLNVAVPPSSNPNKLGLVAGDAAGYPNGRRVEDDVVTIELRAIAGLTIPLVDPSFTPDAVVTSVADGSTNTNAPTSDQFPHLGLPGGGYQTTPGTTKAS